MPDADSLQPDAPSAQQPDPTPLAVLPDVNVGGAQTPLPQAKDVLNLSSILPLLPNQSTILEQIIDGLMHSLGYARNPRVGYLEGDVIPSPENEAYNQTLDMENAGTGQERPRELPLLQGLGMADQLKQLNPPRDESLTDYMFTNPQYPVTTGAPYKMMLPTMPTQTPGDPLPPDPIAPPQAQPRFGATPIGSLQGFGDPNAQEKAGNLLPQLLPWLFAPEHRIVTPNKLIQPVPTLRPANEALLKRVPNLKPLPQDPSQET